MKLLSAIAFCSLSLLAGCSTFPTSISNPISPSAAIRLVDGYRLLQAGIIGYEALPACGSAQVGVIAGVAVCRSATTVQSLKALDKVGTPAAHTLHDVATNPANYPNLTLGAAYQALMQVYTSIKAVETNGGVSIPSGASS